jgi:ribulose-phosphate 3-epimerase
MGSMKHISVAPSILSADFGHLADQVAAAEAGGADAIHVDVMDGQFVPNITVGPLVVEAVRRCTSLPLHVHLMVDQPDRLVAPFASAGASLLIVHQEGNPTLHRVFEHMRELAVGVGVALNPMTPVAHLEESVPFVDLVLVMTVEPGFGGQSFIPTMYDKVARLRQLLEQRGCPGVEVEVDGGCNEETAGRLVRAGATVLVAGSAIFSGDYPIAEAVRRLRASAQGDSPSAMPAS